MTVAQVLRRQGVSVTEDLALGFRLPGLEPADDVPSRGG